MKWIWCAHIPIASNKCRAQQPALVVGHGCSDGQACLMVRKQCIRAALCRLQMMHQMTGNICMWQDEDSESAQKLAEVERLRQAEKFMVVGTGEATCMGCGYEYQPKNGDPEYPITPGTYFTV